MKTEKFQVTGMTCAACQAHVERAVKGVKGVAGVQVNLLAGSMTAEFDESVTDAAAICDAVSRAGYGARAMGDRPESQKGFAGEWQARKDRAREDIRQLKRRMWVSLALLVPLMYVAMGHMIGLPLPAFIDGAHNGAANAFTQMLIALPVLLINRKFFVNGWKALIHKAPNMDTLVAMGSAAAWGYGVFAIYRMLHGLNVGDGELVHHYAHQLYFESSAMILALVTLGKFLEARAKGKTGSALEKLMDLAPKTARVIRGGQEQVIPAEQVAAGDVLVIRPGESVPVDGVILSGSGYLDQSALTGESVPVEKGAGDKVLSASVNRNGSFRMQAEKVGEDTTLAQIIRLVDEAGSSKAPIARLADRVSGVFVPVVMGIALVTMAVWLIAGQTAEFAIACGITVLVISCPCALGLATPVAIMVGTGKAAEYGILIKNAEALETLHSIDTLVVDKTGTLTNGRPAVTQVYTVKPGLKEEELLALLAAVESGSEHPLALAVRTAARELQVPQAKEFSAVPGRGVIARVGETVYAAGSDLFMQDKHISLPVSALGRAEELAAQGQTVLWLAEEAEVLGFAAVADTLRPTSFEAVQQLTDMGLTVVMLTGDNPACAENIRAQLGIQQAVAQVLPQEKEARVRQLQAEGHKVAMVGDGINDAPALARADVGIAIGGGTDIAMQSADVVLMKSDLLDVATAIRLSRKVIKNIHMNLFWAFFYNALGIPLAAGALYPAFGLLLNPMIGSAAMSLSSVCVVTNALRLRLFKEKRTAQADVPACEGACALQIEATKEQEEKGSVPMKKVLKVEGMMCQHCRMHVEKALAMVPGVIAADANVEAGTATVELEKDVADQALTDAVVNAGYEVKGVETVG